MYASHPKLFFFVLLNFMHTIPIRNIINISPMGQLTYMEVKYIALGHTVRGIQIKIWAGLFELIALTLPTDIFS